MLVRSALVACVSLTALMLGYDVVVAPLVAAGLDGRLGDAVKGMLDAHRLADPVHRNLDYYLRNVRVVIGRALVVALGTALLGAAIVRRRWLIDRARQLFVTARALPVDLAVLRIVAFSMLWFEVERANAAYYGALPPEFLMPPAGLGWLPRTLPVDPWAAGLVLLLARVSCLAAILGCLTRVSAPMAVLSSAWTLAIPQLYGKLNHDHHVLWFAALLAVSPCADVLAVDAILAARRRADRGAVRPPGPSRAYALPIRIIWVLLGLIYFFPGFWKAWSTGFTWISAENLRQHMFLKWHEFDGWTPLLRIDEMPLLLLLGALGTVVFELSFLALVLSSRLRALAVLGGLCFHNLCGVFLRIPFWSLQASYAALVDWGDVLPRLGRALFGRPLHLVYDGGCCRCRRAVASLATMDVLHSVVWLDGLHVGTDPPRHLGFEDHRAVMARLPPLWLAWALLHVWPVCGLGRGLYDRMVHRRSPPLASGVPTRSTAHFLPWQAVLGCLLIAGTVATGAGVWRVSWPVALYPTFADIAEPTTTQLAIRVEDDGGSERSVDVRTLNAWADETFQPTRLAALVDRILDTPEPELKKTRLIALWDTLSPIDPSLRSVRVVRFFRETVTTAPGRQDERPIARQLLLELRPGTAWSAGASRVGGRRPRRASG